MRILACCVFALGTASAFAPSSAELHHRYGPSGSEHRNPNGILESETFSMRPGVSLAVHYGSVGRACQMDVSHELDLEDWAQRPLATVRNRLQLYTGFLGASVDESLGSEIGVSIFLGVGASGLLLDSCA
jgi:hypothetical protein